jgi:hypothetical protein
MNSVTLTGASRPRVMAVALLEHHSKALTAGLAPIQIVRVATVDHAVVQLPSVLPLCVAVSSSIPSEDIGVLVDLARTCASEVVAVEDEVGGKELVDMVFEAVRRSDARRGR